MAINYSSSSSDSESESENNREINSSSESEIEYQLGDLFRQQTITGYTGEPEVNITIIYI